MDRLTVSRRTFLAGAGALAAAPSIVLGQAQREKLPHAIVRTGKVGAGFTARGVVHDDAIVSVEQFQVVIIPGDHDGPMGIPRALPGNEPRLFQNFLMI